MTMRRTDEPIPYKLKHAKTGIYYTSRRGKVRAMAEFGYKIDVWIDNEPISLIA